MYVSLNELIWGDSCDGIELRRRWGLSRAMGSWPRSMKFLRFEPFDTLISCKLERESRGSDYECSNIDKDVSVDSLSSKVEIFVSLDIESGH